MFMVQHFPPLICTQNIYGCLVNYNGKDLYCNLIQDSCVGLNVLDLICNKKTHSIPIVFNLKLFSLFIHTLQHSFDSQQS